MKGYRLYGLLLAVLFAGFVAVEYYRPKPINWRQTFSGKDKIPYGTYVLYDLLPDLFPRQPITQVRLPLLNQLELDSQAVNANYIFVNRVTSASKLEIEPLLHWVARGGNVFMSSHRFSPALEEALGFEVNYADKAKQDSVGLLFTHPTLRNRKPVWYAWAKANHRILLDTEHKATVLGTTTAGDTNFVQITFGKGSFFISSVPLAFANYHVIRAPQTAYATQALSHLPVRPVWWDEYQKQGRDQETSVFRVLLAHEALAWAYYLALGGLVLFMLFESKRTQRIIPVVEKPRNTTLEFVRVIGSLYFNHGDHRVVAGKKVNYFLEYLRRHYHVSTNVLDQELRDQVAIKSGVPQDEVNALFDLVWDIRSTAAPFSANALWQLNQKLERFYRLASR